MKDIIINSIDKKFEAINIKINYFDNNKEVFKFIDKFTNSFFSIIKFRVFN